jgi:hypothetical protein
LVVDRPVDDSRVGDSPVGEIRVVESLADDRRAVDFPVAFLSQVDRACQVDRDSVALELVVPGLVDRACQASEAELADRVYQVGQDSVDFRYFRRARCRDDRGGRALSMVVQAASMRAAAPGEFPVESVAQAASKESFQVEWVVLGVSLVGWFLVAVRPAYTSSA